jgi:hypothetical protein
MATMIQPPASSLGLLRGGKGDDGQDGQQNDQGIADGMPDGRCVAHQIGGALAIGIFCGRHAFDGIKRRIVSKR